MTRNIIKYKISLRSFINISLFLMATGVFSSCVTHKALEYLQDKDNSLKVFDNNKFEDYKIKENDDLFISISTVDEAATANFFSNNSSSQMNRSLDLFGATLLSQTVDKEGFIEMQGIGKILVKDKTLVQVKSIISQALVNVLNQPLVSVKLINRFVSVLGEVRSPGHFPFAQDKLSIYDALGFAGDITEYGNRSEVILVRNENGKNIRITLNLAESDILSSEYYFLRPNDIIYVKPLRKKFWGMREFPFGTVLSAISTTILVLNYVINQK